jgi:ketosteroid isomerase-like protein
MEPPKITANEIAKTVRDAYTARQRNDAEAALAFFHPEIRFRIVGSASLKPLTDPVIGFDTFRQALARMAAEWDWSEFLIRSLFVQCETAVVHSVGRLKHVPTGKALQTEMLDKLKLRGGKIVEFDEFVDTYAVAQLLGLNSSSATT